MSIIMIFGVLPVTFFLDKVPVFFWYLSFFYVTSVFSHFFLDYRYALHFEHVQK